MEDAAAQPASSAGLSRFPCGQCGAQLEYAPGTHVLRCNYCGFENPIAREGSVVEHDYRETLSNLAGKAELEEHTLAKCDSCAAEIERPPNATAFSCPFCGADVVAAATSRKLIKPHALAPFRIQRDVALKSFQEWLKSLWFAPSSLKQYARVDHRFSGMYVPHWTYDAHAVSRYTGQRGDDYWVSETYTTTENGQTVTRTRQVRRTRWSPAGGTVENDFDDVLVRASESLPPKILEELTPWDLTQITPYRDEFLSGFRAESYTIGLENGFATACEKMEPEIRATVCADIGGDHQQIDTLDTRYFDIKFKHLLLPVWISAYRYKDRVYRFLVNAQSGETRGERPYSAIKITLFVLSILAVVAAGIWFFTGTR